VVQVSCVRGAAPPEGLPSVYADEFSKRLG